MNYTNFFTRNQRIVTPPRPAAPVPNAKCQPAKPVGRRRTRTVISVLLALVAAVPVVAAEINNFTAPDAWSRGSVNTTYYGWDVFEGGPSLLNDLTPDLNPFGVTAVSMVQNSTDYPIVSASTNLYSGFNPTNYFDITTGVRTDGTVGLGFTTILVQIAGSAFGASPTAAGFDVDSFLINGAPPETIVSGTMNDFRELWWLEWRLPGNQASYPLEIDTQVSSSSLSKITIDTAWHADTALDNTSVSIVPEPTSAVLLGSAAVLFGVRRRRRANS